MKKWSLVLVPLILFLTLTMQVWAAQPIKLIVNGVVTSTDVAPQMIKDRVMVPVRWVAEALGADVHWDEVNRSVLVKQKQEGQDLSSLERRLELLEQAVAAKTPEQAVETWAEGVKMRNGALQYAMLSPELKAEKKVEYESQGWVTGVSSPWVEDYEILSSEADSFKYVVTFSLMSSTGSAGQTVAHVTVKQIQGNWFIDKVSETHVGPATGEEETPAQANILTGIIKETETGDSPRILVEGGPMASGEPSLTWVYISARTSFSVSHNGEVSSATMDDIEAGQQVEVVIDGPMLMSYPAQGAAESIQVIK
jgi:hypothetical protein